VEHQGQTDCETTKGVNKEKVYGSALKKAQWSDFGTEPRKNHQTKVQPKKEATLK
jgi:hypothetical protein